MGRAARWGMGMAVAGILLGTAGFAAIRMLPGFIAGQVESRLHDAGFPQARVEVTRLGLTGAQAAVQLDASGQGVREVSLGWSAAGILAFEIEHLEVVGISLTLSRGADGRPVLAGLPLGGGDGASEGEGVGIPDLSRVPVRRVVLRDAVLRLDGWTPYLPPSVDVGLAAELQRSAEGSLLTARIAGGLGTAVIELAGREDGSLDGTLRAEPATMALPGAPGLRLDTGIGEFSVSAGHAGIVLATRRPLKAGFEGEAPGGILVRQGSLEASGVLRWLGGGIDFLPEGCVAFSAATLSAGGVSASRPAFCFRAPASEPLLSLPESGGMVLAALAERGAFSLPALGPGISVRDVRGRIDFDFGKGGGLAALEVPSMVLGPAGGNAPPAPLAPLSLSAEASMAAGGPVTIAGRLGGAATGRFSARHDPDTGKGGLRVAMDQMVLGGEGRAVEMVSPLLGRMFPDIHGRTGLKASLGWGPGSGPGRAELLIADAGFSVGGVALEGVNAVLAASSLFPFELPPGQEVAVGVMDAGVPLTAGLVRFGLEGMRRLTVQSASWDWAGGVLRARPFALDLEAVSGTPVLEAENVDLGRLLMLLPVDGLSGTGSLSGVLPLRLEGDSVSVTAGRLAATAPGRLSYDPADPPSFLAGGEQGTDLLLRVVTDFRYSSLDMTLDGTAGGEMAVKLAVSGSNPDFYDGYPVALTLNVTGALDTVLRRSLDAYRIPDAVRDRMTEFENRGE